MDVTKEMIEKIASMSAPNISAHDGFVYSDKPLILIGPPAWANYGVSTLAGLVDLAQILAPQFESAGLMCVVHGPRRAALYTQKYGARRESICLVSVESDRVESFAFGSFLAVEDFCIALLSRFEYDAALGDLYDLARNLTSTQARQDEDTGIGQRVVVRAGVATREEIIALPHHFLRPFRSFPDIAQPDGRFLFRVKIEKDQPPRCALFEADGGAWVIAAKSAIKQWLVDKLGPDVPVVA